jgi:transposase
LRVYAKSHLFGLLAFHKAWQVLFFAFPYSLSLSFSLKANAEQSLSFQGFKLIKTGKRLDILHLSKIGDIPIRVHRVVEGKIKQVIIKRHNSGKWFACIYTEKEVSTIQREPKRAIGVDVGIKHFLTESDGRQIENPRFYERTLLTNLMHYL